MFIVLSLGDFRPLDVPIGELNNRMIRRVYNIIYFLYCQITIFSFSVEWQVFMIHFFSFVAEDTG